MREIIKNKFLIVSDMRSGTHMLRTTLEQHSSIQLRSEILNTNSIEDIFIVFDYTLDDLFIEFLGADLGEINEYLVNDGINIIGILGSDFMLKHKVIINYQTKTMYIKK